METIESTNNEKLLSQEFFSIDCESYIFHASVIKYTSITRIRFGGRDDCIDFTLYNTPEVAPFPNMDAFRHNKLCAVNKDLANGSGTITMLKSAITFVKQQFPNIKHIQFRDLSTINCDHNVTLELYYYYLAKYGKTWYQKHFDAQLENREMRKKLCNGINTLKTPLTEDYDTFYKTHIGPFISNMKHFKKDFYLFYEGFEKYYNKNMRTFFKNLLSDIDCLILQYWFSTYLHAIFNISFPIAIWIIKPEKNHVNISISRQTNKPFLQNKLDTNFKNSVFT